jgi:acyl-CoA synthetase (AMP-forming)/AMP-acid ligase II
MELNLADLFECVADAVPDRTALVCGDRRVSYRELDERATRLAHGLADAGIGVAEHVGLCMRNTVAHVETLLACFKRRAVPVNLNWRYEARELALVIDDADLVAVVHDGEFAGRVGEACVDAPAVRERIEADGVRYTRMLTTGSPVRDLGPRSAGDHYLLYTGGTTGRPKGVVWRHDDIFFAALGGGNPGGPPIKRAADIAGSVLAHRAPRLRALLPPGDPGPSHYAALSLGPLMHASGQWGALGTLLGGGTLVLDPSPHLDLERVCGLVEREEVCMLTLVGDSSGRPLAELLEAMSLARAGARWDLSSLRLLGSGGAMLSADVKARLLAALPSVLGILEGIGSSESPAQGVALTTRDGAVAPTLTFAAKPETIVVDEQLHPVVPGSGVVGRLATRGRVPLGYHKDPDRSARTFVVIDGARYAVPGDHATIDRDGTIHVLGRGSTCINTGGEKVFAEEVEAVLLTDAAVADVVVVGTPHPRYGETVCAIVQAAPCGAPSLDELREHCRGQLAAYKAPRELVLVDEIVRTPAGKPDYTWAREQLRHLPGGASIATE